MNLSSPWSRIVIGAALAAGAQVALAQQQLVPAQSEVQFTARQMGVPLEGHFKKFSAQVAFDPAKLATSKIAFTVDTGSATLGSRETDAERAVRKAGGKLPTAPERAPETFPLEHRVAPTSNLPSFDNIPSTFAPSSPVAPPEGFGPPPAEVLQRIREANRVRPQ